uniref:Uncharacterized protein n=1 Tax=Octopus bimaculoides TaxID=37653 RepID=A0A0L8FY04_OCTBM
MKLSCTHTQQCKEVTAGILFKQLLCTCPRIYYHASCWNGFITRHHQKVLGLILLHW